MSKMNYNQIPAQGYINNQYKSGAVYGGNQNNYQYRNYNKKNNFYHRNNTFYNQNYKQQHYNWNDNYGNMNGPPLPLIQKRFNGNQRTNYAGTGQPQRQQQQQRNGPRQLKLNDYVPPVLRGSSPVNVPNLPSDFNLINLTNSNSNSTTTLNTRSTTSTGVLTQRPNLRTQTITTTNNTAQPFDIIDINDNLNQQQEPPPPPRQQQQTTTTLSYRRRQRRNRQMQYRNNNNRYTEYVENDTDIESIYDDDVEVVPSNIYEDREDKKTKKKKQRIY
jgi:hypothetical protein